ncbi:exodeoxyribonuclease III [Gordonia jinghuaiqii]|uniref:Endonuclease/exonuclease/phosphatase family protein n=1 Tax=Gordonia jinghuaiqii TaxID=2758710 RepID=A0A7D7QI36_9ACTN|nr:exodeoxyribonuclease III [Gordonia jinghuaiqii]MCR5980397.1 exodeoxyribonuclease III [Gordonia jinghuaiqii]QMT01864.1 endonuclease/exonuclease/phosphatase family protein [Gordonia jinghuaiqii]
MSEVAGAGFTVASFNVNGIRAARRRGFDDWLVRRSPDVVGLQELRCGADHVGNFDGYVASVDVGTIPGRNGVAVLTRHEPAAVRTWMTHPPKARGLSAFAVEGRYVEVDLADRPLTVANIYLPKGGLPAELQRPGSMREPPDGGAKYARKQRFLAGFARELQRNRLAARRAGREFLLLGDLNVAHLEHDVTNWRAARKMEGFLPEERAWFGEITGSRRLVDVVRALHGDRPGPLTWWSWAGESFVKDVGWRIDHQLASPGLARLAREVTVDKEPSPHARLSDHAALIVEYVDR